MCTVYCIGYWYLVFRIANSVILLRYSTSTSIQSATWFCPHHEDFVLKKRTGTCARAWTAPTPCPWGAWLSQGTTPGTHVGTTLTSGGPSREWSTLVLSTGLGWTASSPSGQFPARLSRCPLWPDKLGEHPKRNACAASLAQTPRDLLSSPAPRTVGLCSS